MSAQEKIQTIIDIMRRNEAAARRAVLDANCKHAAAQAGYDVWHQHNPEDGIGGMGRCPYDPSLTRLDCQLAEEHYTKISEALNYALDTFLAKNE